MADLPIAAVDFGIDWTATDNNHPYVIASHRDDRECLSVGIVPNLIGMPMYDAADAVRAAGLIIAHPLRGDPAQVVTAQDPQPEPIEDAATSTSLSGRPADDNQR